MQLDYRPLEEPVTEAMIKKYAAEHVSWHTPKFIGLFGGGIWLAFMVSTIVANLSSGGGWNGRMAAMLILMTLISIGAVAASLALTRAIAKNVARMNRFAEVNGAVYSSNIPPSGMTGLIFDNGHSRMITESLALPRGVEFGNYRYVTGSGKNRSTHTFGYARVALGRNLPNMVLDAKLNNFIGTSLPDSFDASQKLSLEGDFDKHFDLYVPKDYQRDALYVFTPDVMQALIQHGRLLDMEVVGSDLFMYSKKTIGLTSKNQLQAWIMVVDAISSELKDQSKRYVDERAVQTQSALPVVAVQGQRLKKTNNYTVLLLFAGFVFVVFAPGFLPSEPAQAIAMAGWSVVFIVGLGLLIRRLIKSSR